MVKFGASLYVFGGIDKNNLYSAEVYDIATNKWTFTTNIPEGEVYIIKHRKRNYNHEQLFRAYIYVFTLY